DGGEAACAGRGRKALALEKVEIGGDRVARAIEQGLLFARDEARIFGEIAPIGGDRVFRGAALGAHHLQKGGDEMAAAHCPALGAGVELTLGWGRLAPAPPPPPDPPAVSPRSSRAGMRWLTSLGLGSTKVTSANMPA